MGKWCLHVGSFIFDRLIIKVASNQDRHKSSVEFDFGPNQTSGFYGPFICFFVVVVFFVCFFFFFLLLFFFFFFFFFFGLFCLFFF